MFVRCRNRIKPDLLVSSEFSDNSLEREVSAGQGSGKIRCCLSGINRNQRFCPFADHGNNPLTFADHRAQKTQLFARDEGHIDRERHKVRGLHLVKGFRQAAKRAARWRFVENQFGICRQPGRFGSSGYENFLRAKIAENSELSSPERLVSKNNCRLIATHSSRFATSEQQCSERYHLPLVILSEVLQKQNEVEESLTFSRREKHHGRE
jgi:hypothetical protein